MQELDVKSGGPSSKVEGERENEKESMGERLVN